MDTVLINKRGGQQSRLKWLDVLKGISMMMIILAHSGAPEEYTWLYNPFFLSAFFFVSGYTFRPMKNFKEFMIHKIKGQVYPFFIFGMINAVLSVAIEGDRLCDRLQFLISRNRIWDDMWFIACLISSEIVFYVLLKISSKCTKNPRVNLIFMFLFSLIVSYIGILYIRNISVKLPWQFEHACSNVIFVAFGYLLKQSYKVNLNNIKVKWWIIISIVYVTMVFVVPNHVAIHMGEYDNWAVYVVDAFFGIASLTLCSCLIEKYFDNRLITKYFTFVGANTIVYYAFQSKVIKIVQLLLRKATLLPQSPYLASLIIACMTGIVLIIPAYIIRHKMPFLLKLK